MFFLISIAVAAPSDLPSGECAAEEVTTTQSSGKELYETHCAGCHGSDGMGEKNFFPPLIATPWVESPSAMTEVLFRGVSGTIYVSEERYASYMSPYGQGLTDAEVFQLIAYVRTELNSYDPVDTWTEQTITDLRTDLKEAQTIRGQKGLDSILSKPHSPQSLPK